MICSPRCCAGGPSTEPTRVYTSVQPHHQAPSLAWRAPRTSHGNGTYHVGGPHGTNHVRTGRQSDWTFSAAWVRGEEHGTGTQIAAPDGRNRKSDLRLRRTGDRMAIYLSVNKAIRALWTPMKAPGSVRLQSLAWAALRWGSRRGREWGPAARAGCGRTRSLRGPADHGDGSERRESVGVRGAHLQRPARSSRGRAAVQCCPPVPREGTAARAPRFHGARPAGPAIPTLHRAALRVLQGHGTTQRADAKPQARRRPRRHALRSRDAGCRRAQGDTARLLRARGDVAPCRHGGSLRS